MPTQRVFRLQVVYLSLSRVLSLRIIASMGGHVWVRLLTLVRPSTEFPVLAKMLKAEYSTCCIKYFAINFRVLHESVWVEVGLKRFNP